MTSGVDRMTRRQCSQPSRSRPIQSPPHPDGDGRDLHDGSPRRRLAPAGATQDPYSRGSSCARWPRTSSCRPGGDRYDRVGRSSEAADRVVASSVRRRSRRRSPPGCCSSRCSVRWSRSCCGGRGASADASGCSTTSWRPPGERHGPPSTVGSRSPRASRAATSSTAAVLRRIGGSERRAARCAVVRGGAIERRRRSRATST